MFLGGADEEEAIDGAVVQYAGVATVTDEIAAGDFEDDAVVMLCGVVVDSGNDFTEVWVCKGLIKCWKDDGQGARDAGWKATGESRRFVAEAFNGEEDALPGLIGNTFVTAV